MDNSKICLSLNTALLVDLELLDADHDAAANLQLSS